MGKFILQILDPQKWLSSEISDPKTWHAHPRMQTRQVLPPGVLRLLIVNQIVNITNKTRLHSILNDSYCNYHLRLNDT